MAPTATTCVASAVAAEEAPTPTTQAATVSVRQYRADDHAAVLALFQEGMLAYADHSVNADSLAYIRRSMESDLADISGAFIQSGGNFWVATVLDHGGEHRVVGMVALEKKADGEGELRRMSVKREFRRYGVGKLLVNELERWAKQSGYKSVSLSTGEVMHAAQKFYLSVGFTQRETVMVCDEPYYADVLFSKCIAP